MGLTHSKTFKDDRRSTKDASSSKPRSSFSPAPDSPACFISRKSKSQRLDASESSNTCSTMKSLTSPKHHLEFERENIYTPTPSQMQSTETIYTSQRRVRPPVPVRTDSSRSLASTTTTSGRSLDSSIYESSPSMITPNNRAVNLMTNGHFVPLQSVQEDECLDVDIHEQQVSPKTSRNQQRMPADTFTERYSRQYGSTSSMMSRYQPIQQRASSTDKILSTESINGYSRHQRLPFIIKPAVNPSKPNSLGLCFLICENETKKVLLPSHVSCLDTLKALFVRAFPHHLTMKQMDMEHMRIYIREMDKDIFYQLEDIHDVKDRSVLKLIQFAPSKPHVSFKKPEIEALVQSDDVNYQRLTRFSQESNMNDSDEDSTASRSLSEPRYRMATHDHLPSPTSTVLKGILSSPRGESTTPRIADTDDDRIKMTLMEKQLQSLTALVKELTQSHEPPSRLGQLIDSNAKSLYQQLKDLKARTHHLRDDLTSIRRMQQSLQDNFQLELEEANHKIEEKLLQLNHSGKSRLIEEELDGYMKNSGAINRDLEDLEISVEQLQNDVKTKQCHITINDVETFALVLSTISRSLVDLKASFPALREKLSTLEPPPSFLHEEPERLDYTIKKCKRLTTMLYQLKRLAVSQENKSPKILLLETKSPANDHQHLLDEIHSVTINSDERMKAIEKAEKLHERRLTYERQLESLKQAKIAPEPTDGFPDNQSWSNSFSTRTSICSTDSTNCPSPSLSFLVRQALTSVPSPSNGSKILLPSSTKPSSKVTFSQPMTGNNQSPLDVSLSKKILSSSKKIRPTPPPRIQSTTSSSSAVSSASSSLSSCTSGHSRTSHGFCGMMPLLSPDRRLHGRCYSFSSSSTDNDSIVSHSQKSPICIQGKYPTTTSMRASVTDL